MVEVYAQILALWPPRLVDPLQEDSVPLIAETLPPEMTKADALVVVEEFVRRGSPFPPTWPELAMRWQAMKSGVGDDHDLIAGQWLAEVNAEVGRGGGTFYRPMPVFSDPAIAAAVVATTGSWRAWGETTVGDLGSGGAFTRNLVPERDERFRRVAKALLAHRARTGQALPARLMPPPSVPALEDGGQLTLPDLSMEREDVSRDT